MKWPTPPYARILVIGPRGSCNGPDLGSDFVGTQAVSPVCIVTSRCNRIRACLRSVTDFAVGLAFGVELASAVRPLGVGSNTKS